MATETLAGGPTTYTELIVTHRIGEKQYSVTITKYHYDQGVRGFERCDDEVHDAYRDEDGTSGDWRTEWNDPIDDPMLEAALDSAVATFIDLQQAAF